MTKIVVFIYVVILLLTIFHVSAKKKRYIECETHEDCSQVFMPPFVMRCVIHECKIFNGEHLRY
ncbi:Nodule Cysteine-Rich (NCR) secreted peptide [Medicago truncatula]|uniref:Nodule Cysteine-Rich (NCR) secreted peptide n=2 Tax=Medicago truncatula TaxID=3880 RepID=A7KHH0_MEDTR|nr:nodule-specific cysteine-rich peptide 340 [Medicago truncatula]AES77726.1 Nodule Cysteine-Rich (NCR) secreted peptide [Medicago truncatula]